MGFSAEFWMKRGTTNAENLDGVVKVSDFLSGKFTLRRCRHLFPFYFYNKKHKYSMSYAFSSDSGTKAALYLA